MNVYSRSNLSASPGSQKISNQLQLEELHLAVPTQGRCPEITRPVHARVGLPLLGAWPLDRTAVPLFASQLSVSQSPASRLHPLLHHCCCTLFICSMSWFSICWVCGSTVEAEDFLALQITLPKWKPLDSDRDKQTFWSLQLQH